MSFISGLKSLLGFDRESGDFYEYDRIEPYLEGGPMDPALMTKEAEGFGHEEANASTLDRASTL